MNVIAPVPVAIDGIAVSLLPILLLIVNLLLLGLIY